MMGVANSPQKGRSARGVLWCSALRSARSVVGAIGKGMKR